MGMLGTRYILAAARESVAQRGPFSFPLVQLLPSCSFLVSLLVLNDSSSTQYREGSSQLRLEINQPYMQQLQRQRDNHDSSCKSEERLMC